MNDIIRAISILRVIQTMQEALKINDNIIRISDGVALKDYEPDKYPPSLVYDESIRAEFVEHMFPGAAAHPVVQYVEDDTGKARYYKDTIGYDVAYVIRKDDSPCVVIPLADDLSVWIEIMADGWSVENDWNRPIWHNATPVVLMNGGEDSLRVWVGEGNPAAGL